MLASEFDPTRIRLLRILALSLTLHLLLLLGAPHELSMQLATPTTKLMLVMHNDMVKMAALAPPHSNTIALQPKLQNYAVSPSAKTAPSTQSATAESTKLPAKPSVPENNNVVDANDLRQYRLSLAIAARRFKHYPAAAKAHAWEGVSEVALSVNALTKMPEISLTRSSGQAALDAQALDMIAQAVRVSAMPEHLRGRNFRMLLPVQFSLQEDNDP